MVKMGGGISATPANTAFIRGDARDGAAKASRLCTPDGLTLAGPQTWLDRIL
jgi:hypothetical protein